MADEYILALQRQAVLNERRIALAEQRVAELETALQEIVDLNYGEDMGDAMVQIAKDALAPKGQRLD